MSAARKAEKPVLPFNPTAREVLAHVGGQAHAWHSIRHLEYGKGGTVMLHCSCLQTFATKSPEVIPGLRNVPHGSLGKS